MGKILKYLKDSKLAVTAIIMLLIVQASCDLALPQYTSNIVDVGIGQNGIADAAPQEMRAETYENISLFLTEEEVRILESSYAIDEEGNYERIAMDEEELEALNQLVAVPLVMISAMSNPELMASMIDTDTDTAAMIDWATIKAMMQSGAMTKEQLLEMKDGILAEYGEGELSDSMISQMAVQAVKTEYEAMGKDINKMQMNYLWATGGKMLMISILMMGAAILIGLLASRTAASVGMNLRGRMFKKVVSFSNAEMGQFSTASLITRSTNDIQQVQMVIVMILRMVLYAPILGIGGIIKVSGTKTGMGWIIGVAVGSIIMLVGILMSIAMPKFKKMQTLVDKVNLVSREILTGVSVIRAFSRERYEEKRFDKANRDLMSTQLFTNRVMNFMMPTMMLIMNAITVMIMWFGAKGIDVGRLQVGEMLAFITYTMQIVMSFLMLTMISIMLPRASVAAGRIEEVLQVEPTIQDKKDTKDDALTDCQGRITFEDVSFRYPGADEDALEHISFVAEPGKTTAIIGSTGCGKSTLIHLIPRFYDVTGGRILMDGVDIRDLSQHKLRSLLGFVPQKGVLFSGNIESNLKFGGDWITDEAMQEAADIAQAQTFISEKPDGYQSAIAQGGTNVSGGQKQRLSIARAIAKNPKVFLFDDSFSALDYKTDITLRKALNDKLGDSTVIIVAQRISTILHADQIVVLDDGKIAGIGTHETLLQSCETYREIAKSQLSEAELKGGMVK